MSLRDETRSGSLSSGGQAASVAGVSAVTRSARTAAQILRGRTMLTPHFALHYTMTPTVNRVRLGEELSSDQIVKHLTDSLLGNMGALTGSRRDSALHARLDSLGAPHPTYITKAAEYFERAWSHYDSIGMRMPDSSRSLYYVAPTYGRVAIDIADIGTMATFYRGQPIYGLAFPPSGSQNATILFENDFLYSASYNATLDRVTGTAIRSLHNGNTYRDYSIDWEMGLKVTASHEFYHIIQYEYTNNLSNQHAWYELSATGMEERLAPEVNDYFQYLPYNIRHNHDISLLVSGGELANYGNAIFHVFLSNVRGYGFDRAVWEALAVNNNLPNALVQAAGSADKWDSLWTAYAAAMSISGTPGAASSPLAFSPDMPQWSVPRFDTVSTASISQLSVPAATYRLIRPPVTDTGFINLVRMERGIRVDSSSMGYTTTTLAPDFALTKTAGVTQRTVAAVNSSFSEQKEVLMWKRGLEPTLVQNPVKRGQGGVILLAPSVGSVDSLRVVAETGRRIATIPMNSSQAYWRWNQKDYRDSLVPPGTYYIRRTGQTPMPVLITP